MTIESLPREIISQILFHLPSEQLPLLRSICKLWNQVIDNPIFINAVCRPHFGKLPKVLDKTVWKKFHASYQWLSSKQPCNPQVEPLPLDCASHFATCKEGTVVAGWYKICYKARNSENWKKQYEKFPLFNLGVHREGYLMSYRVVGLIRYTPLYFQKWENNFCTTLYKNTESCIVSFKIYGDNLFLNTIGVTNSLEQWDLNQARSSTVFIPYQYDSCFNCLSSDGAYLAGASFSISLWDLRKPDKVAAHFGMESGLKIQNIDFQGNYLFEGRQSSKLNFWDLRYLTAPIKTWNQYGLSSFIRIDSLALLIANIDTEKIEFWSVSDLEKKQEWDLSQPVEQATFSEKISPDVYWESNRLQAVVNRNFSESKKDAVLKTYTI